MSNNTCIEHIDAMSPMGRAIKRSADFVGALVGLLLFSPVFLLLFIVQKIDGNGPVIYSQERIGLHGKTFRIFKFRTMTVDAEKDGPQLEGTNDPRLTTVGRFLRDHHLDELPQLWNVLIGDMSFVGYRPERQYYIDQIMQHNPNYVQLYCSRPGVTSDATLHNGYTNNMEKMLRRLDMDLNYLRHRSLLLDARILFETFFSIVSGKKF